MCELVNPWKCLVFIPYAYSVLAVHPFLVWRHSKILLADHVNHTGCYTWLTVSAAGAGLGGIPHKFFYPDEKDNYSVLQFGSPAAVGSGLASYVQEASAAAIKVHTPRIRQAH